jgi:uncharacterized membrane protein
MHEVMQSHAETMAQQYLDQLTRFLHALPERDRSDAVREIASHIAESHAAGQPVAVVLAGLGDPRVLARAYLADYYGQQQPGSRWRTWGHRLAGCGFILGSGLTSLFVAPVLGLLALVFGLVAPVVVVLGVLRFLGASWISIRLLPDTEVPQVWSVPVTLAFALVCVALAWGAAKLLRWYMSAILAGYRRVLPSMARV